MKERDLVLVNLTKNKNGDWKTSKEIGNSQADMKDSQVNDA